MLQKNIDKKNRKNRQTWVGYYTRKTKNKKKYDRKKFKKPDREY